MFESLTLHPSDTDFLKGFEMAKALIIVADGFTDSEYTYALDRCREEDIEVHVATITGIDAIGEKGWRAKADLLVDNACTIARNWMTWNSFHGLWDILLLPGGVKSIEKVRQSKATLEIIKLHHIGGKIIGSCCHGAQLLIETGLARNRKIAGYYSIKTDIINAGGEYVDTVAVDGQIVSAAHYDFNGKWMGAVITIWKEQHRET